MDDRAEGLRALLTKHRADEFVIAVGPEEVTCASPSGKVQRVPWSDLRTVAILTTDLGPFAPDLFWVLTGGESRCIVPGGAQGEAELLRRLQELPGFDSDAVSAAMSSVENAELNCWQRP